MWSGHAIDKTMNGNSFNVGGALRAAMRPVRILDGIRIAATERASRIAEF
jgi:hypothetical protein